MVDKLARALIFLSGRTDLIVAILMLVAIAMIIILIDSLLRCAAASWSGA